MKRNEGFTLMELLVTLAAASLVSVAAVSLLLLGTRFQYRSSADTEEQQTVRTALTLLEELAGSGEIGEIVSTYEGWQLLSSEDGRVLFTYAAPERTLYVGSAETGTPLLTGLSNAAVTMEGRLIRLLLETGPGGRYETRVYCRTASVTEDPGQGKTVLETVQGEISADMAGLDEASSAYRRLAFLEALAGEYGNGANTGQIRHPILVGGTAHPADYYAQWYIGDGWGRNGWNADTPWCACFLSWAAVKSGALEADSPLVFADVDMGREAFQAVGGWHDAADGYAPQPGDYLFFDWSGRREDPAHVGAVLDVTPEGVYTIEGNSAGRVAVRRYPADAGVILGYGVLPAFQADAGQ